MFTSTASSSGEALVAEDAGLDWPEAGSRLEDEEEDMTTVVGRPGLLDAEPDKVAIGTLGDGDGQVVDKTWAARCRY